MAKDSERSHVHLALPRSVLFFEEWMKLPLEYDDIFVPQELQPPNPDDDQDFNADAGGSDQQASLSSSFGILKFFQKKEKSMAWKELAIRELITNGPESLLNKEDKIEYPDFIQDDFKNMTLSEDAKQSSHLKSIGISDDQKKLTKSIFEDDNYDNEEDDEYETVLEEEERHLLQKMQKTNHSVTHSNNKKPASVNPSANISLNIAKIRLRKQSGLSHHTRQLRPKVASMHSDSIRRNMFLSSNSVVTSAQPTSSHPLPRTSPSNSMGQNPPNDLHTTPLNRTADEIGIYRNFVRNNAPPQHINNPAFRTPGNHDTSSRLPPPLALIRSPSPSEMATPTNPANRRNERRESRLSFTNQQQTRRQIPR